jgi:hypothetical protein
LTNQKQELPVAAQMNQKLGMQHIYQVFYNDFSFSFDPLTNMSATGNSCFLLVNFYKSSPLNLPAPMNDPSETRIVYGAIVLAD